MVFANSTTPAAPAVRAPEIPLIGTWNVRRRIVDHLAAATSFFTGTASITSTRFREEGQLDLGTSLLRAAREYRLHPAPRGIAVRFPDGAEFIELAPQPSQRVRHVCGADLYLGHFFVLDADTWVEAWRVTGPRKRYASLSRYTRAS